MSEVTEDWLTVKMRDPAFVKGFIDELDREHKDDLQAAVAAERERAANTDPWLVGCTKTDCLRGPGAACCIWVSSRSEPMYDAFHSERWRAAIRKPPE